MGRRTNLTGPYRVLNEARLREKANRKYDPRHVFYELMLSSSTYEAYLAAMGENIVRVRFRAGAISGRIEILYARRNGWIADG
jgi:hypothetical protein